MSDKERLTELKETLNNGGLDLMEKMTVQDEIRELEISMGLREVPKPPDSPYECVGCSA